MSETPGNEQNVEATPVEATSADEGSGDAEATEATGHPAVDAVLASLDNLEDLPVGEHPPIFEEAHEALRSALAQARDGSPGDQPHKH